MKQSWVESPTRTEAEHNVENPGERDRVGVRDHAREELPENNEIGLSCRSAYSSESESEASSAGSGCC